MEDKTVTNEEKTELSEDELADNLTEDVSGGSAEGGCLDPFTIGRFERLCNRKGKFKR